MNGRTLRSVTSLAFATACFALIAAAYLRGNYLLGFAYGGFYALITTALLVLLGQSFVYAEKPSLIRASFVVILLLAIGYAMAFPASIHPDNQIFIDMQATDRSARAELQSVFKTDPAFGKLSISTMHLKIINICISGSLPDRDDLARLRDRIAGECPTAKQCVLHWSVTLRDTRQKIDGTDRELFEAERQIEHY
jgi:hypothetical protein